MDTNAELRTELDELKKKVSNIEETLKSLGLDVTDWNNFQLKRPLDILTKNIIEDVIKDLRNNKRSFSITTSATPTPDAETQDMFIVTALGAAATFGAPTGNPTDNQILILRIQDDGTARALSWNSIYRAGSSVALPTTTTVNKMLYLVFIYNSIDSKWDLVQYDDGF